MRSDTALAQQVNPTAQLRQAISPKALTACVRNAARHDNGLHHFKLGQSSPR